MEKKKKKIRVYLRALEPEDYAKLHQWRNDEEIGRLFSGTRRFTSTLNEKKWVEDKIFDKENVSCAVCLKETDEFIGCMFLYDFNYINRSACGSSFIGVKELWGKGYATDAKVLSLKHAFHDKGLERVWAYVLADNNRSLRLLEKCNYKKEGLLRRANYVDGEFKDLYVLSILREEFDELWEQYEL